MQYQGKLQKCSMSALAMLYMHSRTAAHISIEEVLENGVMLDGDMLYEIEDPRGQFEEKVLGEMHIDQFKSTLTEQDKVILQMRYDGYSLKETAEKVGFKTPSAVAKRIEKIAGSYEDFIGDEYNSFLDKHSK